MPFPANTFPFIKLVVGDFKVSTNTESYPISVGDKEVDPLLVLACLDLVLRNFCTCSRTRCCPELYWFRDGRASDVSSTFSMAMTDFRGSRVVIFRSNRARVDVCGRQCRKTALCEVIKVHLALPCLCDRTQRSSTIIGQHNSWQVCFV